MTINRRIWLSALSACAGSMMLVAVCRSGDVTAGRENLKEPVYRVNKPSPPIQDAAIRAEGAAVPQAGKGHPLDPALDMATKALERIQTSIRDYTCTLVKQERVDGVVLDPEYIFTKIRNRRVEPSGEVVPFSVYMRFLKPSSVKGREVIYIEDRNSGKMVAHEGGVKGKFLPTVWLKPEGTLAMRGNRYPITEVGIVTLTQRLIERGQLDRQHADCSVEFKNATINGRKSTCLQVQHPVRRPHFDFFVARIFIDDDMGIPVRYEAYDWPRHGGGHPELIEAYTYLNMKLNVGLNDQDFSHTNAGYNF